MSSTNHLAPVPPMGWNSWDCFGTSVVEDEVLANASFMAQNLLSCGWNTIVVDIQWYEPGAQAGGYRPHAPLTMDGYGRLLPALNRFPSATGGLGFAPMADFVHSLGLKFGLHVMRGIPRQAVERNLPICSSTFRARDVANPDSLCPWNTDMVGLDLDKPGAQAYIDSLVALYAGWGVDYVKVDDMLAPYHTREIEAYSLALQRSPRPIILSLSPGVDLDIGHASHLRQHAELWRISADFWDRWEDLKKQFALCALWAPHAGPGQWPDADMLPIGHIGIRAERGVDRHSLLTPDEQVTLLTLWCICRSPLMIGGDLPTSSPETIALLTNPEVLAVNQASSANREFSRAGDQIVWTAQAAAPGERYVACFNTGDAATTIEISTSELGFPSGCRVRDLWKRADADPCDTRFAVTLPPHGAALFRFSPP